MHGQSKILLKMFVFPQLPSKLIMSEKQQQKKQETQSSKYYIS